MLLKKMRPLNQAIISVEFDRKSKTSVLIADVDTHFLKSKPLQGRYSAKAARRMWNNGQRHLFTDMEIK